jgi:hypothetical protein
MSKPDTTDWVIERWLNKQPTVPGGHSAAAERVRVQAIEALDDMVKGAMMMSVALRDHPEHPEHVEAFACHRALLELGREVAGRQIASFRMLAGIPPEPNELCAEWRALDGPSAD